MAHRELANILAHGLPPRKIFRVVGWHIGETHDEQFVAALTISSLLLVVAITIYVGLAFVCCSTRKRHARAGVRRSHLHPRAVDAPSDSLGLQVYWTVHNKRYDLRAYVASHPGGASAILLGQGRNCTELFESYHSLANEKLVRAVLQRHYVEDAPSESPDFRSDFNWQRTPFYDELKRRVRGHFEQTRGSAKASRADTWQWSQLLFFTGASCWALWGFLRGDMLSMLLLPFCYWWGPSPCMHDGGHFSLSRRPWVNQLLARAGAAHMSLLSWQHQHTIGHHVHTSMAGADPDLYHFGIGADNGMPGFRTCLEMRTLPEKVFSGVSRQAWWRFGLLLRIPFTTFGPSILWDPQGLMLTDFGNAFMGMVPYMDLSMRRLSLHSAGRAIVIWLAIIHPITISLVGANHWLSGIWRAVFFVAVPYAVHGCLFYVFSQVSHIQDACFATKVDETSRRKQLQHAHPHDKHTLFAMSRVGKLRLDPQQTFAEPTAGDAAAPAECELAPEWAVHQVGHALDYAVGSRFWTHASVGLNLQAVHHLFPQVGWGHYRALHPIIAQVCQEFNVRYTTAPTFQAAVRAHWAHLKAVNEDNASLWVRPPKRQASRLALDVLDQIDYVCVDKSSPVCVDNSCPEVSKSK